VNTLSIPKFENLYIPTVNKKGFMLTNIDALTRLFIDEAIHPKHHSLFSLDVGAAYGIATREVLRKGGSIFANDTDPTHLAAIESEFLEGKNLKFLVGDIRHDIHLPISSISCALFSRVLHFFYGEEIITCLKKVHQWLIPGGKIFVSNETPYFGTTKRFIPLYEQRKKNNHPWPGLIESLDYFCPEKAPFVDLPVHLFDEDLCYTVAKESGFTITDLFYMNRNGFFPENALYDGRESIAFIAQKT